VQSQPQQSLPLLLFPLSISRLNFVDRTSIVAVFHCPGRNTFMGIRVHRWISFREVSPSTLKPAWVITRPCLSLFLSLQGSCTESEVNCSSLRPAGTVQRRQTLQVGRNISTAAAVCGIY